MLFAHDTEVALTGAAALINTEGTAVDALTDPAALARFVAEWRWTGELRGDTAELEAVRALRSRLRRIWTLGEAAVVEEVNDLLRRTRALPQLVRHDDWPYHLHATSPEAPLADRMAVEAAMALVDVVRLGELTRLASCAATNCDDVLVDLSKNRSRRYCSTVCTNRMNVAAYRSRRATLER